MTSLDTSVSGVDPEPDALLRVQVPERVPRRLEAGQNKKILGAHSFFLIFGGIWAGVGGFLTLAFSLITFAAPPMLLGAIIGLPFFLVGVILLVVALRRAARDRDMLENGRLVLGTVTENKVNHAMRKNRQYATKLVCRYEDPTDGREFIAKHNTFDRQPVESHVIGRKVPLLIDSARNLALAPTVTGVRFRQPAPIVDERPANVKPGAHTMSRETLKAALWADLDPPKLSVWDRLGGRRHRPVGEITLLGSTLRIRLGADRARRSIDLDRPFTVNTSAWLSGDKEAEVEITVRPATEEASAPAITFRTVLSQDGLSSRVPIKQGVAPFTPHEDAAVIWNALGAYAAVHGRPLKDVTFTGGPSPSTTETVQRVQVEEVAR